MAVTSSDLYKYMHSLQQSLYEEQRAKPRFMVADRDPKYPHRCLRCGCEAYIGLNQIEHRQSEKDKTCK